MTHFITYFRHKTFFVTFVRFGFFDHKTSLKILTTLHRLSIYSFKTTKRIHCIHFSTNHPYRLILLTFIPKIYFLVQFPLYNIMT